MRARELRTLLWCQSIIAGGAAIGCIIWAFYPLPEMQPEHSFGVRSDQQPSQMQSGKAASLNHFDQLSQLDLRKPLHDPPPTAPPVAAVKPIVPLNIQLAGVIIEPGHSEALIVLPDGSQQLKAVGDRAGDALIKEIKEDRVTVDYLGRVEVLTVHKEGGG